MSDDIEISAGEPTIEFNQPREPAQAAQRVRYAEPPTPPEEVYVDGVAGGMGRGGVFKFELYRVTAMEDQTEVRTVSHRLIIPNMALGEFAQLLQRVSIAKQKPADQGDDPSNG